MRHFATFLLTGILKIYRAAVSPWLPPACRYRPTCSAYAQEALAAHGPLRGGRLVLRRLLSCHPWGGHGYDPVPPARTENVRHDA
jgi:putative membrane protein insertion efficiency factor